MLNCCQKCLNMNKIILYVVLLFVVIFSHGCACRKVLVDTPKIKIIKPEHCNTQNRLRRAQNVLYKSDGILRRIG